MLGAQLGSVCAAGAPATATNPVATKPAWPPRERPAPSSTPTAAANSAHGGVAAPVSRGIEGGRPAASGSCGLAVGVLVGLARDAHPDPVTPGLSAVAPAGVCLVGQHQVGRVRGRPPPGRCTLIRSKTLMNCGLSPR
jgi:hypothetical protein